MRGRRWRAEPARMRQYADKTPHTRVAPARPTGVAWSLSCQGGVTVSPSTSAAQVSAETEEKRQGGDDDQARAKAHIYLRGGARPHRRNYRRRGVRVARHGGRAADGGNPDLRGRSAVAEAAAGGGAAGDDHRRIGRRPG